MQHVPLHHVTNKWLRDMLDLECFVISGLKADQTSAAIMAFTFAERHKKEGCVYDYPIGGRVATHPGCQMGHMDNTGCHQWCVHVTAK
jgi:hypothetical protein